MLGAVAVCFLTLVYKKKLMLIVFFNFEHVCRTFGVHMFARHLEFSFCSNYCLVLEDLRSIGVRLVS